MASVIPTCIMDAMMALTYWAPAAVWMAFILWLSTDDFSAQATGAVLIPLLKWLLPGVSETEMVQIHALIRKVAHPAVYAIMGLLWYRMLWRGRAMSAGAAACLATAICAAWAGVDELHQSTVWSRSGRLTDVGLDSVGAAAATAAAYLGRRILTRLTPVLVWLETGAAVFDRVKPWP